MKIYPITLTVDTVFGDWLFRTYYHYSKEESQETIRDKLSSDKSDAIAYEIDSSQERGYFYWKVRYIPLSHIKNIEIGDILDGELAKEYRNSFQPLRITYNYNSKKAETRKYIDFHRAWKYLFNFKSVFQNKSDIL